MKARVIRTRRDIGTIRLFVEITSAPDDPFTKESGSFADSMAAITEALLNHGPHFMIRAMKYLPQEMVDEVQAYLASWPGTLPWLDDLWAEYEEDSGT